MRTSGLIVEYNPLHNGHRYHILRSKEISHSDYTIGVMSGHFLQRGEPAIYNKWFRTKMALQAGIDVVIELPTVYSCQNADLFSYGAIQILDKLGVIDSIVFGSEHQNIKDLQDISQVLAFEQPEYQAFLQASLREGCSFPSAREKALKKYISCYFKNSLDLSSIIGQPNNILGIEYIKWLLKFKSSIEPKSIKRIGASYHDKEINNKFSSATAIRNLILNTDTYFDSLKGIVPPSTISIIREAMDSNFIPAQLEGMSKSILPIILRNNTDDLKKYLDIKEGLDNRLHNLLDSNSLEHYIKSVKTKRYTYTRLQRILCHILLNLTKDDMDLFKKHGGVQYIRILGFTDKGKEILPIIKKNCKLPMITNVSKVYTSLNPIQKKMLDFDILATNLYNFHFKNSTTFTRNMDFSTSPIIIK